MSPSDNKKAEDTKAEVGDPSDPEVELTPGQAVELTEGYHADSENKVE